LWINRRSFGFSPPATPPGSSPPQPACFPGADDPIRHTKVDSARFEGTDERARGELLLRQAVTGKRDSQTQCRSTAGADRRTQSAGRAAHPVPPDRTSAPQGLTQFSSIFFRLSRPPAINALEELGNARVTLGLGRIIGRVLALAAPAPDHLCHAAGPGRTETVDTYPVNGSGDSMIL